MSERSLEIIKAETRRLESLGVALLAHNGGNKRGFFVIKGEVFKIQTLAALVLMIVRYRHEKALNDLTRERIKLAGQQYGLIDTDGKVTAKYFVLLDDDAERLARELTGQTEQAPGLCGCGCGRVTRGRAKTATQACRKRLSRQQVEAA